jgi:acetyl/propionyl-CoA carboxylase alpha subunit/acetyl-CoA carboxylase carboxyltransferase component
MAISRLLIANRGEVAVRIIRTAAEMGITTVAVYSEDDAACLHVALADERHPLEGSGAAPYLDMDQLLAVAKQLHCDAIHPGWGFLSENPEFCDRCGKEGIVFVGPRAETLSALGDKTHARSIAASCGVPTLKGSAGAASLEEARAFFEGLGAGGSMIVKAVSGGGGRGMRVVTELAGLDSAYARCASEALRAFGNGALYVEERVTRARHVEIQVIGDGTGNVSHLWERDCSIQRRHQKLVEIAPSPVLQPGLRERLTGDAVRIASMLAYTGVGTFEFLLNVDADGLPTGTYAFIEANPRLQVEHTITEEILGIDLVRAQLLVTGGETLEAIGLDQVHVPAPRGIAMQLRVNTEQMDASGGIRPSTGTLGLFQPPTGPGVRIDSLGYPGYATSSSFDSLLGKVVIHTPSGDFRENVARSARALREFRIEGVQTNIPFLKNLLDHPDFQQQRIHTTFVDEQIVELAAPRKDEESRLPATEITGHSAGAKVDTVDPLAVLAYGKRGPSASPAAASSALIADPGTVLAPMQSTVVSFEIAVGDTVRKGQDVAVLNAMKMEHVLKAPVAGVVRRLNAAPGDTVVAEQLLVLIEESDIGGDHGVVEEVIDLDYVRPDLAEILERHRRTLDEARPEAVESRRQTGHRTARENIEDLCDPGTFVEYGPIVLASPRPGDSLEDLIRKTPGDGILVGIGAVNGDQFGDPAKWCMVMSYDYTVWAGTQGGRNHAKTDRGIYVAEQGKMPVILIAEGGGGRASGGAGGGGGAGGPGTTVTFAHFARLNGLVPLVGITTGRCFAGNASLLGCCDVIIATEGSNIGMGGPAMIEGGGLGVFAPEDIGPMEVQVANGVVDIAVADEAEAMRVAKQYMSYFQGPISTWETPDQRKLRHIIPENRLRVYDVRAIIETLTDAGSVLELRKDFGVGMITSFARIEGRPVGIVANNPMYYGGAITSEGADKAARFMKLCDAFDIPLVFLVDTPGIMVGPEIEKTALVRHSSRMFVVGADLSVPCMAIILRKAYGLGAIAMTAGSYREPYFTVSWPTGEFGGMGLEGQVKLGFRNQLAAIEDTEERRRTFDQMVARAYERGRALNEAVGFGLDDTIDPAESRKWVASVLRSVRIPPRPHGKKRGAIDTW